MLNRTNTTHLNWTGLCFRSNHKFCSIGVRPGGICMRKREKSRSRYSSVLVKERYVRRKVLLNEASEKIESAHKLEERRL